MLLGLRTTRCEVGYLPTRMIHPDREIRISISGRAHALMVAYVSVP
jgi:hypothetical protein